MTDNPEPQKPKGVPTWVWFVATFAGISLLGNIVLGGNTWITTAWQFIAQAIPSNTEIPTDTSGDDFCLSGSVSDIDKSNTLTVVQQADQLVQTTTGAIGFAAMTEDPEELADAIKTVRESGAQYLLLGERLLTAKDCADPTYEYLMKDFGDSLVAMGNNFGQWDPDSLLDNPVLLITATPLIEQAANKAQAIIVYVENLN